MFLFNELERAIDTANSILEGRNVKVIPKKNLKEQSFGDFEAEKSVDICKDWSTFFQKVIVFVVVKTIVML